MAKQTSRFLTTFEAAKLMGVDMGTVIDWCQQGKLTAFKTPGGHRRITPQNLLDFLQRFKMPIPASLGQLMRLTCLIVDDQPDIRKLVERVIKSIDDSAEVDQAQDGFEAGTKLLERFPNLIVLDIGLPGINGFNICKRIRSDDRFKQTKILIITGNNTPEAKEKMEAAGADEFLPKPFDSHTLKNVILKLVGQQKGE